MTDGDRVQAQIDWTEYLSRGGYEFTLRASLRPRRDRLTELTDGVSDDALETISKELKAQGKVPASFTARTLRRMRNGSDQHLVSHLIAVAIVLGRDLRDVAEVELVSTQTPEGEARQPDGEATMPSSQAADLFAVVSQWLMQTLILGFGVSLAYCTVFGIGRLIDFSQRISDSALYLGIIVAAIYQGNIIALRSPCDPPLPIKGLLGFGLAAVSGGIVSLFLALLYPTEAVSIHDPRTASGIVLFLIMTFAVFLCAYSLRTCILARRCNWTETIYFKRVNVGTTFAIVVATLL
ncbi:hypothetical protein, partial [Methylobacterium sp. WL8]|uniref:hypothetical protein n=1 Tax=Methylobacterium sp. WL8 TaxID=2603899 RepID=UPI0011CBBDDF